MLKRLMTKKKNRKRAGGVPLRVARWTKAITPGLVVEYKCDRGLWHPTGPVFYDPALVDEYMKGMQNVPV